MSTTATRIIGDAVVAVSFDQWVDNVEGLCAQYRWTWTNVTTGQVETEADLRGPLTGNDKGPASMLATLLSFMEACGESYEYTMRHPDSEPENLDLFPEPMREWCYVNSDAITMIRFYIEGE